jgi:hypothetical protein
MLFLKSSYPNKLDVLLVGYSICQLSRRPKKKGSLFAREKFNFNLVLLFIDSDEEGNNFRLI